MCGVECGLPPEVAADWQATVRGFLAHAAVTPVHLGRVLEAQPGFAQGHAAKGLFCLLLGRAEMVEAARGCLAAAGAGDAGTARERAYVAALADWLDGRPSAAANRLQGVLDDHPGDALAMKLVQAIWFVLGRPKAMRASVEGVLPAWADHPALGYLKGCHAFTLEETGEYRAAEAVGRAALELAPDDAWGLHAVAHVHDMTGRAADGLAWLDGREAAWAHCNNFRFHVWWHRALMLLDLGRHDAVLDLYDREVRAEHTDDYRDIANAASLLARLELDGVHVGARWEELAAIGERRAGDGCLAFADLHYLLALIGDSREDAAMRLIGRMARGQDGSEPARIAAHPGAAVARGLRAFAAGAHGQAWLAMRGALGDLQSIGGSHAQRDVFVRIGIEAAIRGGYLAEAENMLRMRSMQRAGTQDGYTLRRLALVSQVREEASVNIASQ
jgi:tetratricopeptide (TPR) repeat protein